MVHEGVGRHPQSEDRYPQAHLASQELATSAARPHHLMRWRGQNTTAAQHTEIQLAKGFGPVADAGDHLRAELSSGAAPKAPPRRHHMRAVHDALLHGHREHGRRLTVRPRPLSRSNDRRRGGDPGRERLDHLRSHPWSVHPDSRQPVDPRMIRDTDVHDWLVPPAEAGREQRARAVEHGPGVRFPQRPVPTSPPGRLADRDAKGAPPQTCPAAGVHSTADGAVGDAGPTNCPIVTTPSVRLARSRAMSALSAR